MTNNQSAHNGNSTTETGNSYYDGWAEEDAADHQSFVQSMLALAKARAQAEATYYEQEQE